MFESFGFETLTAPQAVVILGLVIGAAFGALAEVTRFCFRRGLVGEMGERRAALGVWLTALAVAVIGTQGAISAGLIAFDDHRFMAAGLPLLAILIGGALFGGGMVLTRGCVSRLSVLAGSGNLRALTVILVFAVTAHATLKGVLAPIRTALGGVTVDLGVTSLAELPGGAWPYAALIALAALACGLRSGAKRRDLGLALLIGALVPAAWVGTGFVLYDDFDPVPMESLSFTLPAAEALFWGVASSSISATFGTGLLGGVVIGAAVLALISGRFGWASFESPRQTGRYLSGAFLMGVGGVLAGGCTVGAGLAGVPTLAISAVLAILSIAGGAKAMDRLLSAPSRGVSGAQTDTPQAQPAE